MSFLIYDVCTISEIINHIDKSITILNSLYKSNGFKEFKCIERLSDLTQGVCAELTKQCKKHNVVFKTFEFEIVGRILNNPQSVCKHLYSIASQLQIYFKDIKEIESTLALFKTQLNALDVEFITYDLSYKSQKLQRIFGNL